MYCLYSVNNVGLYIYILFNYLSTVSKFFTYNSDIKIVLKYSKKYF